MNTAHNRTAVWLSLCLCIAALVLSTPSVSAAEKVFGDPEEVTDGLLQEKLRGPLGEVDEVVFAVHSGTGWHWYETFGYVCQQPNRKKFASSGRLCRLNLRTGEVKVILDVPGGSVRDPCVHYSGDKILFSYRPAEEQHYHLYEINPDGTGLRQLTSAPRDDIEPVYLPDGGIMFCSSRSNRWVPCFKTQVATLYRCDGDGSNIRQISSNVEHDNTPWVLPDGRVLYTRWEYVHRGVMSFHHLWTINPDGTGQMTYFGNMHPATLMIDAKPVPGTDKLVSIFSPWHGGREHNGTVAIVDPDRGPDNLDAARIVNPPGVEWKEPEWRKVIKKLRDDQGEWRDPYALSEDCILAAREASLCVIDGDGRFQVIYSIPHRNGMWLHEPRPLISRPREPVLAKRADWSRKTATLVLQDITIGRNMEGVEPGTIKKLLVVEELPKPVSFHAQIEPSIGQHNIERVLGTVQVEPDGSAHFKVPPVRSLVFLALDENDRCVKPMYSFVTLMPGEMTSCVGCHEPRTKTPPDLETPQLQALRRPADKLQPVTDVRYGIIDYPRDIQPILDRHCVKCHNADDFAGRVNLTGDRGPVTTLSYEYLGSRKFYREGPDGNVEPYSALSGASDLPKRFTPAHHDVQATPEEVRLIKLWLDTGACFAGTYAALGSGMVGAEREALWGPTPDDVLHAEIDVLSRRCDSCHLRGKREEPFRQMWHTDFPNRALHDQFSNLSHPEKSVVLRAPLAKSAGGLGLCKDKETGEPAEVFLTENDPDYRKLLGALKASAEQLNTIKRYTMDGFVPNEHYIREMKRYGVLPESYEPGENSVDVFEVDQRYFRSFWHRPEEHSTVAEELSE